MMRRVCLEWPDTTCLGDELPEEGTNFEYAGLPADADLRCKENCSYASFAQCSGGVADVGRHEKRAIRGQDVELVFRFHVKGSLKRINDLVPGGLSSRGRLPVDDDRATKTAQELWDKLVVVIATFIAQLSQSCQAGSSL